MHSHEIAHGETVRQNPTLRAGSAQERSDSQDRFNQRDVARHRERLQVGSVSCFMLIGFHASLGFGVSRALIVVRPRIMRCTRRRNRTRRKCKRQAAPKNVRCTPVNAASCRSGVFGHLFAALQEQQAVGDNTDCFGHDSASVKVYPDGIGARKKNGSESIGKSRGGWNTKIHMVSASDRQAMIFRLSDS